MDTTPTDATTPITRQAALAAIPTTIGWPQMQAAGIDIHRVEPADHPDLVGYGLPTWRAVSADGQLRVTFGLSYDTGGGDGTCGEHPGWDARLEHLMEGTDADPVWEHTSQSYYQAEQLEQMLAAVAAIVPSTPPV